ncbi:MAG: phosphoribosylformimino-5-aminoimidazole carboxamide ribotide isomerase [Ruminococcus sp.]|nr:phosphoribosylformimino-5-aminoimidazole carboxamide ribotide isomerase [Ruminococcus sp.]
MRFRPCIDIHNGSVKQIVGSSLRDEGDSASDNFVSEQDAGFYAGLYKENGLTGGHVIILNPQSSEYYEKDLEQARKALSVYRGGLQIGGGINTGNAEMFLEMGASHVIVTSFVFREGKIDFGRLKELSGLVGRKRLTLDLSCKKRGGDYYIVTDRWQKFTDVKLSGETMEMLAEYCDEFLIHAADAEGRQKGIESGAARIAALSPIPCTYAGGIASMEDIELLSELSGEKLDFTVGSALDLFGGSIEFRRLTGYGACMA